MLKIDLNGATIRSICGTLSEKRKAGAPGSTSYKSPAKVFNYNPFQTVQDGKCSLFGIAINTGLF